MGCRAGEGAAKGKKDRRVAREENTLKFNSPCVYYGVAKIGDEQVTKVKGIWNNGGTESGLKHEVLLDRK